MSKKGSKQRELGYCKLQNVAVKSFNFALPSWKPTTKSLHELTENTIPIKQQSLSQVHQKRKIFEEVEERSNLNALHFYKI